MLLVACTRWDLSRASKSCLSKAALSTVTPHPQDKVRKPDWLKRELPGGENYGAIKTKLRELKLATVGAVGQVAVALSGCGGACLAGAAAPHALLWS